MFVDIDKLSLELNRLNTIINQYDNLTLDMYKKISESSSYWNSKKSIKFYSNTSFEKSKNDIFIIELKNYRDIYSSLIDKYKTIGNKIYYDLSNDQKIINIINKMIDKYNAIIVRFNSLGIKYDDKKNKVIDCRNNLLEIKNGLVDIFNKIQKINDDINKKLSDLKIEYVKETEFLDLI